MADQPARPPVGGGRRDPGRHALVLFLAAQAPGRALRRPAGLDRALRPLYDGLTLALRLLRESGRKSDTVAEQGAYQQMLGGKQFQMLRVWVDPAHGVFPEISANKYMIWIRFSTQDGDFKPQPVARDVPFQMTLCNS